jgi:hypothetical protein
LALRDHAERQVRAGVHADLSEAAQAGSRRPTREAFRPPRRDLAAATAGPTENVDPRAPLLPFRRQAFEPADPARVLRKPLALRSFNERGL